MNQDETGLFFIQVAPGFEALSLMELELKFKALKNTFQVVDGGIEGEIKISDGLILNKYLKIPNKILLRIDKFKCRDLPKLFNKVKKLDLKFFNYGQDFTFFVSSYQSRLFDDRKIIKTLKDALAVNLQAFPPKKKVIERLQKSKDWNVYCRFYEDTCTLSLDTSGERLGKRGYKESSGKAPLRENLAAGLWLFMSHDINIENTNLLDPFAGSGTFLMEAGLFNQEVKSRSFTYESLLTSAISNDETHRFEMNSHMNLYGYELDKNQYECLEKNMKVLNLNTHLSHQDNNEIDQTLLDKIDYIISNPPYRDRVHGSLDFWDKTFTAKRIGILMPPGKHPKIKNYNVIRELSFSHGGKDVIFKVLEKDLLN